MSNLASRKLSSVEVLRGLAALWVCLFHLTGTWTTKGYWPSLLTQYGYAGVDAFFVVSGFVIPLALDSNHYSWRRLPRFLLGRAVRLYPAFLLTVALSLGLWYLATLVPGFRGTAPVFATAELLSNLSLTANVFGHPWTVPVFWTLAVEAQYYLVMGLVFPLLVSARLSVRISTLSLWLLGSVLAAPNSAFASRGAQFALGIVAFLLHTKRLSPELASIMALAAGLVALKLCGWVAVCVACLAYLVIVKAPEIRVRWLLFLGSLSYSLYLIHVPIGGRVTNLLGRFSNSPAGDYAVFLGSVSAALLCAYAMYACVEKPSHGLARRLWRLKAPESGSGSEH